ncbi:MAG: ABC transporter substrate-binding protein [Chloroflexota bacterium]
MGTNGHSDKPQRLLSRRVFLRLTGAGVLASGAAPLLQACGTQAPAPTAAPTQASPKPAQTQAPAAPASTAAPAQATSAPTTQSTGPQRGGTLRVGVGADHDNLDPHFNPQTEYGDMLRFLVFDALTWIDENMQVSPLLAESWEYSPDASAVTVKLRKGAKFHNGRTVTAKDIAYNYDRAKSQGNWTISQASQVKSTDIIDDYTFKFNLTAPNAYYMSYCSDIGIVAQEASDSMKTSPVGSGAFKFVEQVHNNRWVLDRFADYWGADKTYLDRIQCRILPDLSSRVANLEANELDAVRLVGSTEAKRFQNNANIKVSTSKPGANVYFFHMTGKNNAQILKNKKVRQALAYSLDRKAINDAVFGGQGQAIGSPLSPAQAQYLDPGKYTYDPEKTRQMLKDEGISNFEFTIDVQQEAPETEQASLIWAQGLAKAGVKANVRVDEAAVWLNRYVNQDYDVLFNGFPPSGDPNRFFTIIIGRFQRAGVYIPENGYSAKMLDQLMPQAKAEVNKDKSLALFKEMQQIVADELPVMPIVASPTYSLLSKKVQGWINLPNSLLDARNVWMTK